MKRENHFSAAARLDHFLNLRRMMSPFGAVVHHPPTQTPRTREQQATSMVLSAQKQARKQLKRLRDQANGGYDNRRKASAG